MIRPNIQQQILWPSASRTASTASRFGWNLLFAAILGAGWAETSVWGQPKGASAAPSVKQAAQEQRRNWVRKQITKLVSNEGERAEILARLNDMNDDQIQELAVICLDELESRRQQQFAALREANARERVFQQELSRRFDTRSGTLPPPAFGSAPANWGAPGYWGPPSYWEPRGYWGAPAYLAPRVGYIPVITWLPEGVGLSAQAVVSPDGRHVRTSVVPFFSTIGPVHTFNYMTGETRRYDR